MSGQSVAEISIDELTREVREHKNIAKRVPVIEERIKVASNHIKDLKIKT